MKIINNQCVTSNQLTPTFDTMPLPFNNSMTSNHLHDCGMWTAFAQRAAASEVDTGSVSGVAQGSVLAPPNSVTPQQRPAGGSDAV